MAILSIKVNQTGMEGVSPKIIYIDTNDTIATVTAEGYLNAAVKMGYQINIKDVALVSTKLTPSAKESYSEFYEIQKSNDGNWSLTSIVADPVGTFESFDVTVTQAELAAGGVKTLFEVTGTKRYRIRELFVNSGGTNFSGGGGDRLLTIGDNATAYSDIPAATIQALDNYRWGATELPFPGADPINTQTVAGNDIIAFYSGGTSDYTAGSITISGILERTA